MTLSQSTVDEVRRLLALGGKDKLSQRKIAKKTGHSRGTVSAIASGKRKDFWPEPAKPGTEAARIYPAKRCGGCGGLVYGPCRACRTRKLNGRGRIVLREVEGPIRHELKTPDEVDRLADLRRRKAAAGEL